MNINQSLPTDRIAMIACCYIKDHTQVTHKHNTMMKICVNALILSHALCVSMHTVLT